jgi:hypothetical protein
MTGQPADGRIPDGSPSLVDETARALTGYYGRLGRIGLDLAGAVLPFDTMRFDVTPLVRLLRRATGGAEPAGPAPGPGETPGTRTLLVEADSGRPGFGVFVVENLTAEPVSAPITVSAFVNDAGHQVRPRLVLRPATVSLEPGQQAMVQLAAELDEELETGVRYRGEIAVPALSDRRIPIVLRRVAPADGVPNPSDGGATEAADAGPETTKSRRAGRTRRASKLPAENDAPGEAGSAPAKPRRRRATSKADSGQ